MILENFVPDRPFSERPGPKKTYFRVIDAPEQWSVVFEEYKIMDPSRPGCIIHGFAYFAGKNGEIFREDYNCREENIDKVRERVYMRGTNSTQEERDAERAEIYRRIAKIIEEEEK